MEDSGGRVARRVGTSRHPRTLGIRGRTAVPPGSWRPEVAQPHNLRWGSVGVAFGPDGDRHVDSPYRDALQLKTFPGCLEYPTYSPAFAGEREDVPEGSRPRQVRAQETQNPHSAGPRRMDDHVAFRLRQPIGLLIRLSSNFDCSARSGAVKFAVEYGMRFSGSGDDAIAEVNGRDVRATHLRDQDRRTPNPHKKKREAKAHSLYYRCSGRGKRLDRYLRRTTLTPGQADVRAAGSARSLFRRRPYAPAIVGRGAWG